MGDACRTLDLPVTGGNVSFHNESKNKAIYPTPVIGMLGIIEDINKTMSPTFKHIGDQIYVLGKNKNEIGGSEYLKVIHNQINGNAPEISDTDEKILIELILDLIDKRTITAAHDISEGGIAIALAEMSILSGEFGCSIKINDTTAGSIFGETQSRIIISLSPNKKDDFINLCNKSGVIFENIGEVIADNFIIENVINTKVDKLVEEYESAIPNIMV